MRLLIVSALLLVCVVNVDSSTNVTSVDRRVRVCELSEQSSTFLRTKLSSIETDLEILKYQMQAQTEQIESQKKQLDTIERKLPPKSCPFGFEYLPEIDQCLKLVLQPMTWYTARATCGRLVPGAKLAMIANHAKQAAVTRYLQNEFIKPQSSACVRTSWRPGGKMAWLSGQTRDPNRCGSPYFWKQQPTVEIPFSYTNWSPSEPTCTSKVPQHCLSIATGREFRWVDDDCHILLCSVCEL